MSDGPPRTNWRIDRDSLGIWTLWFDRPGRSQNILDPAALDELDACLDEVKATKDVRGLLIRSPKPSGFCAGADLQTIQNSTSPEKLAAYLRRGLEVFDHLENLGIPTAAVIHGACLGGGLELALACRFRIALASGVPLQVGTPEVHFGLIPGWGAISKLPRLLAPRDALDLLLSGNPIGFLQTKSQGLSDRLVSQEEPERILETLRLEGASRRPFNPEVWRPELEFALAKTEESPIDHPEAQAAIIRILEIDLAKGTEAARKATVEEFLKLAARPATQQSIASFFDRSRSLN